MDKAGQATEYAYDGFNRLKQITYPPASLNDPATTETFKYDARDLVIEKKTRKNDTIYYTYDEIGRLQSEQLGTDPITYYYYTKSGAQAKITRGLTEMKFAYDKFDQLTTATDMYGKQIGYGYDTLGRRDMVIYPSNNDTFEISYGYDNLNRLSEIYLNGTTRLAQYTYDELGRRETIDYGNKPTGVTHSVVYDYEDYAGNDNVGSDIEGVHNFWASNQNMNITYVRDGVGNILGKYINDYPTNEVYAYDNLYQLREAYYGYNPNYGNPSIQSSELAAIYEYDALGNRKTVSYDNAVENYCPQGYNCTPTDNQLNQYSSVEFNSQSRSITYDAGGNMTQLGNKTMTYDHLNRMRTAEVDNSPQPNYSESYQYDLLGRRVRVDRSIVGQPTASAVYVYDGPQIIAEYMVSGASLVLSKRYVYGPGLDEPLCMINYPSGDIYYYHYDGQGNVLALSNGSGAVVEMYEYDAFGAVAVHTSAGSDGLWLTDDQAEVLAITNASTVGNPFLFTGRQYDSGIGLYYYRARMYSPELGRFCQPDPIGYADGMNLYAYCRNNPVNFIDPWGLCKLTTPGGDKINVPDRYDPHLQKERSGRGDGFEWFNNVRPGGQWDWKRMGHKDGEITHPEYEDLGNFDYGVTGAARGMPRWLLHWGARRAGGGNESQRDTDMINEGYDWYLLNTPDHLLTPGQRIDKRNLLIQREIDGY